MYKITSSNALRVEKSIRKVITDVLQQKHNNTYCSYRHKILSLYINFKLDIVQRWYTEGSFTIKIDSDRQEVCIEYMYKKMYASRFNSLSCLKGLIEEGLMIMFNNINNTNNDTVDTRPRSV